jgi:predicted ribosome quality control (RQC) complex YloA/Tae2 family protein
MSFDGIITRAIVAELNANILGGKIEKIYQPESDELVFHIHSKSANFRLYVSCNSSHARVHFINENPINPFEPLPFCMLLRKHIQGGRISKIIQKDSERIIEFSIESYNELGLSVNKRLIIEIMGKHSNIILIDIETNKIIDSIKRISIDVNRYRQILPGKIYEYPPSQGKLTLEELTMEKLETLLSVDKSLMPKVLLSSLQGISPAIANNLLDVAIQKGYAESNLSVGVYEAIAEIINNLNNQKITPVVYLEKSKSPMDFHIIKLESLAKELESIYFDTLSSAMEFYFANKNSSNRIKQKSVDLEKAIQNNLNKLYLKKQRLSEDLLDAKDSENYRLFGELLTASLHQIKLGESQAKVNNYYDNTEITIPLDKRLSPSKNAQQYFKKYGKSKTAVKEKTLQLEEVSLDIEYVESVASFLENAVSLNEIEAIRAELIASGYLRKRKTTTKPSKIKSGPYTYTTKDGFRVLVGRNNVENDILTFKTASPKDIWFHAKNIPGSHVILFLDAKAPKDQTILEAASLAALHSKAKDSENVPVDYTKVRYVKKPNGAKPGMVIFTGNKTVYVDPYKS